ncbi:MAG: SGNH/GDSL hydrolase family protein [Acidobacteriota bacterium]
MSLPVFRRYVALGDSSTEGLNDPDGQGGFRGWADRLADRLADHLWQQHGEPLRYANLAIRGRRAGPIRAEQLAPALAMEPDLATVFAGTNDAIGREFDVEAVAGEVRAMQRALIDRGATVLTFTMPDLTAVMPLARRFAPRLEVLNQALRQVAGETGALLVDFAHFPTTGDRRFWSDDRMHANALGHERMAAALADALGLPGSDRSWADPLPPSPPTGAVERWTDDARWARDHLLPWAWRRARGRSRGDGRGPKRPELQSLAPPIAD